MFITSLINLPGPLIMMFIVDDVFVNKNKNLLIILSGALFFITIFGLFTRFIQKYILFILRQRVILDIQMNLFEHIIFLDHSFYENQKTGYLMSRIRGDVSASQGLFADTFLSLLKSFVTLILGSAIIYIIHWKLALISTFILPLFIISLMTFSKRLRSMSKLVQEKSALVSSNLQESLSAYQIVKSFVREKFERNKFFKSKKEMNRQAFKTFILGSYAGIIIGLIGSSAPLVILVYGGMEIINGRLTLGQFIAFNSFLGYLFGPAKNIFNVNISIQKSLGSVERIFEILDTPIRIKDEGKLIRSDLFGNIEFRRVYFSYDEGKDVLEDINLDIKEGETIGIIGPSGSGKTTLANLIPRFYDPTSGTIFVDGIDIKTISLACLRKHIGIVHQDTFLFSGSIIDNIIYGNSNASIDDVIRAANLADAHEFIMELPKKYETEIGERGLRLSGGQKQRITIARAIIKNPGILILDEAVSWLDPQSEEKIKKALIPFIKKFTTIIITHRVSTIVDADRIILMERGRIIKQIDPKSLSNKLGHLTEVYFNQFRDIIIQ